MQQLVPDFSNFFWTDAGYVAKHNEKALPPRSAGEENEVLDNSTSLEEGSSQDLKVKIGVFLEPEEHMRTAFLLHHPMDTFDFAGLVKESGFQNDDSGASLAGEGEAGHAKIL